MADEGLKRAAAGLALALALPSAGCGAPAAGVATADVRAYAGPAVPFPATDDRWGMVHSARFAMNIPLPDPSAWAIDDQSRGELIGLDKATHSSLVVLRETEADLVNHQECEARARVLGLVPTRTMSVVEDLVTTGPEAYDTRVRVAIDARAQNAPIVGHVFAFGAYVRKCLFVHLTTGVASEADEKILSDRLALARVKLVGGIRVDELGAVPREPHPQ